MRRQSKHAKFGAFLVAHSLPDAEPLLEGQDVRLRGGTAEVTQLLEEYSMNRAVNEIFSGRILDADVNSDFGKAAEQFKNGICRL